MISRCRNSVSKKDFVFPSLLYCDSRCAQTCLRLSQICCCRSQICHLHTQASCCRSQVLLGLSLVLPGVLLALSATLKAGRNALQRSDTLLKLTHLSLHSTSSQNTPGGLQWLKYILLMPVFHVRSQGCLETNGISHPFGQQRSFVNRLYMKFQLLFTKIYDHKETNHIRQTYCPSRDR
jgi:hypothetical protein